jgi:predicted alpha/beta hydrolase family esterase
VRQPLPFRALVIAANDDPYCAAERSRAMAGDWGARYIDAGRGGHLNGESGLGDWPRGRQLLNDLLKEE